MCCAGWLQQVKAPAEELVDHVRHLTKAALKAMMEKQLPDSFVDIHNILLEEVSLVTIHWQSCCSALQLALILAAPTLVFPPQEIWHRSGTLWTSCTISLGGMWRTSV